MDITRLFNRSLDDVERVPGPRPAGAKGGPPETPVGQFITTQSLVTFPGATAAISLVWFALGELIGIAPPDSKWLGFVISAGIALVIYWINITDDDAKPTPRQKRVGFVIACFNALVLFAASSSISGAWQASTS